MRRRMNGYLLAGLIVTGLMAALILLFSLNLIPLAKGYLDDVKEAVRTDYTQDVLAVFGES